MSGPAENVYHVIVIGAGPVGYAVAGRTRAAGLSVAVVERELVGGECSYWACIPSKAMLRPVVAVADACRVAGARQAVSGPVDAWAVFARRDGWVTGWNDEGQAAGLKSRGAELIRGHGRLDGHPAGHRADPRRRAGGADGLSRGARRSQPSQRRDDVQRPLGGPHPRRCGLVIHT
jgi:pyruvate/2-oxoglutarate dehydrogenase complex dihydrolipoamide dehydrogenase (E3) component